MGQAAVDSWLLEARGTGSVIEFFAELGVTLPDRGGSEAAVSCFANPSAHARDDRNPSCSVNLISGVWKCQACGAQGNAYKAAQALGRSDKDAAQLARRHDLFLSTAQDEVEKPKLPHARDLKKWVADLQADARLLKRLEDLKGWTPWALKHLHVGFNGEWLTFVVRDRRGQKCGVVRYSPNPKAGQRKTWSYPGTKRNLFPPPEFTIRKRPLFVVEGEPAAVSVFSVGFQAVGVPGAGSWRREWAERLWGRQVIVLPDCDRQGRDLAARVVADVPGACMRELDGARTNGYDVGDLVAEDRDLAAGVLASIQRWAA